MKNILLSIALICFVLGSLKAQKQDLALLKEYMVGQFSSESQAKEVTNFLDISLIMTPVWEESDNDFWLYVEQALSSMKDKPYRQRVYHVMTTESGKIKSEVWEIDKPERFVLGKYDVEILGRLKKDDLIERPGCAIYLERNGNNFKGQTNEKDCKSDFGGAAYATSEAVIDDKGLDSWDRGWSAKDEQVWGSQFGAYQFRRK